MEGRGGEGRMKRVEGGRKRDKDKQRGVREKRERRGREGWKEKQYERDRWVGEVNNHDE